jgi:hypothetical protein
MMLSCFPVSLKKTLHLINRYDNISPANKKTAPEKNIQGLEKGG